MLHASVRSAARAVLKLPARTHALDHQQNSSADLSMSMSCSRHDTRSRARCLVCANCFRVS
eukprot:6190263-Pleurochrysis_carterae.AAC.1